MWVLVVERLILFQYYYQIPNATTLYVFTDGPAGQPADDPPISHGSGYFYSTVPESIVWVDWQPGPPIWRRFGSDPDLDQKWWSRTVANISLLGSTLPSTLSRGKTLPISLDYMLTCTLLHARSRDLLSCRSKALGGVGCRRCGATLEQEGRELFINTPPHLSQHPTETHEKEWFWVEKGTKRVIRYGATWPWGSTKSRKEWVKPKAGKDRVCNSLYVIRWYKMKFYLPRGLPNIYSPSLSPSPLPLDLHPPLSPSPSPSLLYLCTHAVARSSVKLTGGGG